MQAMEISFINMKKKLQEILALKVDNQISH